jgi:hypothetical protein
MICQKCLIIFDHTNCVKCKNKISICDKCYLFQLKKYFEIMLNLEIKSDLYFEDLKRLDFYIKYFENFKTHCWFCLE